MGPIFSDLQTLAPSIGRGDFLAAAAATAGALSMGLPQRALASSGGAETIFVGGPILPFAGSNRPQEALAVAGGNVLAVGSKSAVMAYKTASTTLVDLDGRTLLPGFIDAHQHTLTGALVAAIFTDVGYTKYKTQHDVLAAIAAQIAKQPAGSWVYAYNFDNVLQGGDLSIDMLDKLSPSNPIMVYYINMHVATANSLAFKAAKIPDSIGELPGGGNYARDASGKFNGMIYEEPALKPFLVGVPKITPDGAGKAVVEWLRTNAAAGNTSVHEAGVLVFGDVLQGYERVAAVSPCRASISLMYDSMAAGDAYEKHGRGAQATQLPETLLTLYAIKIVGDGSNQMLTGYQTEPYLNTTTKGQANYDAATLKMMVADVKAKGWPVSIHANGDATLDYALDAIESVYGANPATGVNRIEHCTITRPDQIARMKTLGVQPSFLMNHIYFYGAAYRDQFFGPARAARADAAADCVKAGLPFTLHTDAPCSNIGTLQLVQTAVTRRCNVDGSIVGADQAITVGEALDAVTINAAGQIGMSKRLGTLEAGKYADLTVLDANPHTVDAEKIMAIKVTETWVGGRKAFSA
jgi:predicted amidohydrolase YtcJ